MEVGAFLANCEQRGIELFLDEFGEIRWNDPANLVTERFRGILRDYEPLIRSGLEQVRPAPVPTANDGFDEEPATDTPIAPAASARAKEKEETPVQLVWEQGRRIPWMVVCWIGKTEDRYTPSALFGQYGFGESKVAALQNLLATLCNVGTPANLRRIVGRVYAELEGLSEGDSLGGANLATTDHGLPPVFEWKKSGRQERLVVRFNDGCYLEAKGVDQAKCWETMQRHPAATPEQQWWLLKAERERLVVV